METIKKENIQISDNNNTLATQIPTNKLFEVNDEKSKNENSVQSQTSLRALFKKSNTCGSLYVNCSCSNGQQPLTVNKSTTTERSKSEKDIRRIKLFQSFSHPDTTTVFTDENKYAANIIDSPTKAKVTSSKSGQFEVLHSKRSSTPNFGTNYAFHPEFVLKKLEPKPFCITSNPKASPIKTPKPILKKSSKSFPGHSPNSSDYSIDYLLSSLTTSNSVEEVDENEDAIIVSKNPCLSSPDKSSNNSSFSNNHIRQLSLKYAEISCDSDFNLKSDNNNNNKTNNYNNIKQNSVKSKPNSKFDDSAQQFFIQSGILGPMGNGVTSLLRKSSKIAPVLDPTVKEQIRKNSMLHAKRNNEVRRKSIPGNYDNFSHYGNSSEASQQTLLEEEISNLKQLLKCRDEEISKLKREIHKLKSVLQQTASSKIYVGEGELLSSIQTNHEMAGQQIQENNANAQSCKPKAPGPHAIKKQGVSGESSDIMGSQSSDILIPKYDKDFSSKQLIKDAIMDNDFLKNIDSLQIREIVDSMYSHDVSNGEYLIREGEAGAHLYVSSEGEFEVIKDKRVLGIMGPGRAFGELAILYNCTRTASVRVLCDSRVWVLDRRVFQQIMMRTGMQRIEENVNFLRSVPLLKNLSNDVLTKIADVLEVEFYPAGAFIIRQGAGGDTFFLLSQGTVKVTQQLPGSKIEEEIRILGRGEYFGEQALIKEDKRTANIIAMSPGVECLTLDRDSFTKHIGDLCELHEKDYGDEERVFAFRNLDNNHPSLGNTQQELLDIQLNDLQVIATLGVGGFGRVELVKCNKDNKVQTYALKCLKKRHIVDTRQEEHVFSERKIMLSCQTPFICRLYRTYRDDKYVYMLLEACMGGEVWTILRDRVHFDDHITKFIIGCVLQAFEYLHTRGIVYRDLKPENLMLDGKGYVKLVDFGFAKFIGYSSKTWTFCGTPEYVAPEIILNKGHDRTVDYWALGVLIHELLTGIPPFTASDPMKTYTIILKGIDMVNFPKHMPRAAISLIKRLCRDVPSERLGYQRGGIQDIRKHKWFHGFDWDGLGNLTLKSPLSTKIRGPMDMSNFDVFPSEVDIPPDEKSGWDADF